MPFTATKLALDGLVLVTPRKFPDARGYFLETYRQNAFAEAGVAAVFVQDNQAFTARPGTIRGLHFQRPPHAQAKLVRVVRGSVFDVAVDLRPGSATFGQWIGVTLTGEGGEQLFVPRGFAHGYCSLQPDTEVIYKCDAYYAADAEGGLLFSDPEIGIEWPVSPGDAIVSDKDRRLPRLADMAHSPSS